MPPRFVLIILGVAALSWCCHGIAQRTRSALLMGDAVNLIDNYYVDPVDRETLVQGAMDGMIESLDPHSSYIPASDLEAFHDVLHQEFAGIGIMVSKPDEDSPVRVITPLVGSPAMAAGLLPGDEIVGVNGEDVSEMQITEVSDRLRGPVGTEAKLQLRRGERIVDALVTRDSIRVESVMGDHRGDDDQWQFRLNEDPTIAYIRLTTFGELSVTEFHDAYGTIRQRL